MRIYLLTWHAVPPAEGPLSFLLRKAQPGNLVAYGALLKGDKLVRGFFRQKLGSPENPTLLTRLEDSSFYLIGNSYITMTQGAAYYVVMDKHPTIYKAVPGRKVQKLSAFPDELRIQPRPDFTTRMSGPSSAAAHFAEIEKFTLASGLFSQDGQLYLLVRKPDSPGKTAWFLYKIDPDKDRVVGQPLRLPTSANHLTVVPSKDVWILIERGPVKELQQQVIDRIVEIPASAITSMTPLHNICPAN